MARASMSCRLASAAASSLLRAVHSAVTAPSNTLVYSLIDDLVQRHERHLVRLREALRCEVKACAGDRRDLRRNGRDIADKHGNGRRFHAADLRRARSVSLDGLEALAAEDRRPAQSAHT